MEAKPRGMNPLQAKLTAMLLAGVLLGLTIANLMHTPPEVSKSERRRLAALPRFASVSSGKLRLNDSFAEDFEAFAQDSFVGRDAMRALKAYAQYNALRLLDNNGLYAVDGSLARLSAFDAASAALAIAKINKVIARLPDGAKVYMAAIPDKGHYLARGTAYPDGGFGALEAVIRENLAGASYISLGDALGRDSYYAGDLHWKQTALSPVLAALGSAMGFAADEDFEGKELYPFYGAYFGQYALPLPGETLACLTNDALANARVKLLDTKTLGMIDSVMYDESLFFSVDPYSVYLSGPQPIVTIENPAASTDRQLYLFRDSFASSLAPLLAGEYAKITLIDLRYISGDALFKLIGFDANSDALFLYGSLILNDSALLLVG